MVNLYRHRPYAMFLWTSLIACATVAALSFGPPGIFEYVRRHLHEALGPFAFSAFFFGVFGFSFIVALAFRHGLVALLCLRRSLGYGDRSAHRRDLVNVGVFTFTFAFVLGLQMISLPASAQTPSGATSTTTGRDAVNNQLPVSPPPGTQPSTGPVQRNQEVNSIPYARSFPLVVGAAAVVVAADRVMSACTGAGLAVLTLPDGSTPTVGVPVGNQILGISAVGVVSTTGAGCVFTGLRR